MSYSQYVKWTAGALVSALLLSACQTVQEGQEKVLRADPAEDSGFVEGADQMQEDPNRPYNRIWYDQKVKDSWFSTVYVAPVNTDYLQAMSWWDQASTANLGTNREQDVKDIAEYFREAVKKAIREDPKHKLAVVDTPTEHTLILEMAIIELVPTKAWLNTMTTLFVGSWDHGAAAFEARVRDGRDQKVIAKFADRQYGKTAVISAADFRWWTQAHKIMDDWAQDMVNSANAAPDQRVDHALPFDVKPW